MSSVLSLFVEDGVDHIINSDLFSLKKKTL